MATPGGTGTTPAPILEFGFHNSGLPGLNLETFDFTELKRRARYETLMRTHRPSFHQLSLFTRGQARATVDFVDHDVHPGTILHIRPGQVQRLPFDDAGEPAAVEALMVIFAPSFPQDLAGVGQVLRGPRRAGRWQTEGVEFERLTTLWGDLDTEHDRAVTEQDLSDIGVALLRQILGTLLLRIARLPSTEPDPLRKPGGEIYAAFEAEVERSFALTRSVTEYAHRLGYSTRTLARACQSAMGRSAKTVIDARVILEAKRLLTHSTLPVANLSTRLGFPEPTTFGKYFKTRVGLSPGAFREMTASGGPRDLHHDADRPASRA